MLPFKVSTFPSWTAASFTILVAAALFLALPIFLAAPAALVLTATAIYLLIKTARLENLAIKNASIAPQFQALINTIASGVIIYDQNFTILSLNDAAERILNIKREEVVKKKITPASADNSKLKTITQVLYPSLAPSVSQISDAEWPQIAELRLENPDLILRATLNKLSLNEGDESQFIKIIEDKTRAEQIMKSKREFLNTAAHQLRTPVTAMSWAFDVLVKETRDTPNLKTIAEEGSRTAARALKTVNDLLNAAQIEEGRFGYIFQEADIVKLIEETVGQAKAVANETGINLSFQTSMEPILLQIDPQHIGIVLANFLDNAIRYNTQNGRITVNIEQIPDAPFVKISVSDTGVGIPEADTSKIFTKFFRASNITNVAPNGTGLGLYIAKNIVKNHGGDIGVISDLNRGATFWFTLPTDPNLIPKKETLYDQA